MNVKDFRLKEIRETHEHTQLEVANKLNVQRGTYASWECGNDIISTKQLYKLANIYQASIDYIVNLTSINNLIINNKPINLSKIGNNLKHIRQTAHLSQLQIAESIGINQSTWWGYEHGKTLITLTSVVAVAQKYNYSIDWILGRSNKEAISQ